MSETTFKEKVAETLEAESVELQQLELNFRIQYSDIQLKEAVRGVKAIVKEAIRLGAERWQVDSMLKTLAHGNPMVYAAADAIEEALLPKE